MKAVVHVYETLHLLRFFPIKQKPQKRLVARRCYLADNELGALLTGQTAAEYLCLPQVWCLGGNVLTCQPRTPPEKVKEQDMEECVCK